MSRLSELADTWKHPENDGLYPRDPSVWLDRLINTVEDSEFTEEHKKILIKAFKSCLLDLDIPF